MCTPCGACTSYVQERIHIYSDSQLVVNQVNKRFAIREYTIDTHLKIAIDSMQCIVKFELLQLSRVKNGYLDSLSNLTSSRNSNFGETNLHRIDVEVQTDPLPIGGDMCPPWKSLAYVARDKRHCPKKVGLQTLFEDCKVYFAG